MSRYTAQFNTEQPGEAVEIGAAKLKEVGFVLNLDTGIWKKGNGILVAPQLATLRSVNGGVRLEAWLKFALLPGVYLGEFDLEGSFMLIPKRQLRASVAKVEEVLESAGGVRLLPEAI